MNSIERINAAIALKPVDRVPVSPLIIGYAGMCSGKTQREIYTNVHAWIDALEITYSRLGLCDTVFTRWPRDVIDMQMLEYRLPGDEIDEDSPAQVIEKELMNVDEYDKIISSGYTRWFFNHIAKLWSIRLGFPASIPLIIPRLLKLNVRTARTNRNWTKRNIPTNFDSACYLPFDLFSLVRSAERFFYDIADIPDKVEKALKASIKDIIKLAKAPLRFGSGRKICIYPMRSSASFISPAIFERFAFPYLKELVESFWKEGIISVLHCDGNWTPMLKYLAGLPAGSCIVELDGDTDIFYAKSILGDHLCLKGNIPASLLAFGTEDEVKDYCYRLVQQIGAGSGFILSSGCEVPLNARFENVKAVVNSIKL